MSDQPTTFEEERERRSRGASLPPASRVSSPENGLERSLSILEFVALEASPQPQRRSASQRASLELAKRVPCLQTGPGIGNWRGKLKGNARSLTLVLNHLPGSVGDSDSECSLEPGSPRTPGRAKTVNFCFSADHSASEDPHRLGQRCPGRNSSKSSSSSGCGALSTKWSVRDASKTTRAPSENGELPASLAAYYGQVQPELTERPIPESFGWLASTLSMTSSGDNEEDDYTDEEVPVIRTETDSDVGRSQPGPQALNAVLPSHFADAPRYESTGSTCSPSRRRGRLNVRAMVEKVRTGITSALRSIPRVTS